jgi:Na+-translocating ferredoxin:NAD+ oxidoreductase RnfD subunit
MALYPHQLLVLGACVRGMEGKVYLLELVLLGLLILAGFCCLAVELLRCELFSCLISFFLSRGSVLRGQSAVGNESAGLR